MDSVLRKKINSDLLEAQKNKDEVRLQTLRLLTAALHNREIEARGKGKSSELTDEEILEAIGREVKKRKEAIALYTEGNRPELAKKEQEELSILEVFLPQELSIEEVQKTVDAVIGELHPSGQRDFGRVMGEAMKRMKGRVDGTKVGAYIKTKLEAL